MSKYTAQDFRNSKFAEHPDGRRAVRKSTPTAPWIMEMRNGPVHCARDGEMSAGGWVPVPDKPTITQSEFDRAVRSSRTIVSGVSPRLLIEVLGITVVPDPEPTNAEKLEALYDQWLKSDAPACRVSFHQFMDDAGVKAPGGAE